MAVTQEVVTQQIKALNVSTSYMNREEIKCLPEVLEEGEAILFVTSGIYNFNCLIVATNVRLIFMGKEAFSEIKTNSVPYDRMYAVNQTAGFMFSKVSISIQGEQLVFDMMEKPEAAKLAEIISNCVTRIQNQGNNAKVVSRSLVFPVPPPVTTSTDDAMTKVKVELPVAAKQVEPQKVLDSNESDIEVIINSVLQKKEVIDKVQELYFSPNISEKKKAGAMGSYVHLTAGEEILCLYDSTVFGGAKEVICLTNQAIYWKAIAESGQSVRYEEIASVTVKGKNLYINDKQVDSCPAFNSIKTVLDQIVGKKDVSTQPTIQSTPVVAAPVEASARTDSKPDAVDSAEVYFERARAQDDYDLAIADYTQAIKLKPDYAEAYLWRGVMYNIKDDDDLALADYTQAIKLKPELEEELRGIIQKSRENETEEEESQEEVETPIVTKQAQQRKEKFFWRPSMGIVISTGSINNDFEIIDTIFAMDSAKEGIFSGADPDKAFAKVKEQLKAKCKTLGGNAVLDCQFEYRFAVGEGLLGGSKQVIEIFAYGTVVKIN
jgi:tetratricopeptide (TPR) repeat protein